jgi:hypothetical protein
MDNHLCGLNRHGDGVQSSEYTYTSEGFTKLCEALKGSAVTWLMCGAPPAHSVSAFLSMWYAP